MSKAECKARRLAFKECVDGLNARQSDWRRMSRKPGPPEMAARYAELADGMGDAVLYIQTSLNWETR